MESSRDEIWGVIEKLPVGVFLSRAGRVVYANATCARILGYDSGDELLGFGPEQMLAESSLPEGQAIVVPAGAPFRSVPRREWRAIRKDGSHITVETEATQQLEFHGQRAVLWTIMDVTELRSVQAQLVQADRLAAVGLLAAGVAHEVNNPLTYVLGALELLRDKLPQLPASVPPAVVAELAAAVAEATDGAERVRVIVRDLKTFSRVEQRPTRLSLQRVLDSSLQMAMNEIRPRARLERSYDACPEVLASEASVGQLFLNLIINAAQAIPEGAPADQQIRVATFTDADGHAIVEIRDTGVGVAPEMTSRIFDPFVTTKPIGVGTGLGLSICRNITTSLGGSIELDSELGRGTTVRVRLPPAPVEVRPAPPAEPPPISRPWIRGRVLVVDDEPAIVGSIVRLLGGDHEVVPMTSAREAHRLVQQGQRFDLIVSDLLMPEMTGMDLHAALLAIDPDQAARMLFLTGGAFTPAAAAFLDRTTNPRLIKPFGSHELRALVQSLVAAKA